MMLVHRKSFFVGGTYHGHESNRLMTGQMYVEELIPEEVKHALPLVLIHGDGQTAMNWMTTPDGRPGWAEWFTNRGWKLFILDRPSCGRSARHPDADGLPKIISTSAIEKYWTASRDFGIWPQAKLHTQWPGTGRVGDPCFDQYYASTVPSVSRAQGECSMQTAGAALLDKIGPAILIGHSLGGLHTWLIGDARSDLVRAIIALEPSGPPYKEIEPRPNHQERLSGLTFSPLTYDPKVTMDSPLVFEQQQDTELSSPLSMWLQTNPPRRLVNLAKVRVVVVTAQASYHSLFDHFTARYLLQAGVRAEHVRLEDHGICGNGHLMMLEKNNLEIAALVERCVGSSIVEN